MMNPAIHSMLSKYNCVTKADYENALKEIIQELALLGLWRSKFFEHAAFYGGTALRILYQLDCFSEDLDFSLLKPTPQFNLAPYLKAIQSELGSMGFEATVTQKNKTKTSAIDSAFIKADVKGHMLKIMVPNEITNRLHSNSFLNIKLEVDTDPPSGFSTEAKILLQPIPFSINTYSMPDLFAGKLHAILHRNWKSRVKGRDYYDYVWYIARNVPVRLSHLEQRMRQSGSWEGKKKLTGEDLLKLLQITFSAIDIKSAKRDVTPFLRDPQSVDLWSEEFFVSLLDRLNFT